MSQRAEDSENLSPKAAAFSIASLLTKDLQGNSNASKTREMNLPLTVYTERENCWTGHKNDLSAHKAMSCAPTKEECEGYSIQSILNGEYPRGDEYADGNVKREMEKNGSNSGPLHQLAACCDLVRTIDTLKDPTSLLSPQMRILDVQREVQVAMQQSDLWWKFYACGTEMVITRTGR